MRNIYPFGKYRQWLTLWMYFQQTKCLFAIGITLPGHSKVILAVATPCGLQLCSTGRRSVSRSLLYEYAAWDSNWCAHECKSHWRYKLLFCYLWIYYYYYCAFLYSCVCWVASHGSNDQSVAVKTHLSLMSRCTVASSLLTPTGELIWIEQQWSFCSLDPQVVWQFLGQIYRSISHWNYSGSTLLLLLLLTQDQLEHQEQGERTLSRRMHYTF